jgi:4-amino-4-deoxy-L-arabinose transferase-like glycosyltransferase
MNGRTSRTPWLYLGLMLGIVLIAAAVRFHGITAQSLWNDEGNSYVQATRSLADIAANAARDIHPPGYYWLLSAWTRLAGTSELALRGLSAFASILAVALTFALGRRAFGRAAGVIAALFTALNSFSLYYAQETRMYALLGLCVVAMMLLTLLLIRRPTRRRAVLLGLVMAAGLYTQYAFPLFMLAGGAFTLICIVAVWPRDRQHALRLLGHYAAACLLGLALFLPWLPTALTQLSGWQQTGADVIPFPLSLYTLFGQYAFGLVALGAGYALPVLLLIFGLLYRPHEASPRRLWPHPLLPLLWVALPTGLFIALGMAREQNLKLMLPAQLGLSMWMAGGVAALWHLDRIVRATNSARGRRALLAARSAAVGVTLWITLQLISGVSGLSAAPELQRANYRGIAQDILRIEQPGDVIVLNAPNQAEVFGYYYDGDLPVIGLPEGLGGNDAETAAEVSRLVETYERAFVVYWGEAERDPSGVVAATLSEQTFAAGERWYGDVRLARYVMPDDLEVTLSLGSQWEHGIVLSNAELNAVDFVPGDVVQLRLWWRTGQPVTERYKVFIHLIDASHTIVAQRDTEPANGLSPTTSWPPDTLIADNHAIPLPADLPPGHYLVLVGLYAMDAPNERLRIENIGNLTSGARGASADALGLVAITLHAP